MFRAVIFDMDELLVDSGALWTQAEQEVFQEVGIELHGCMFDETVGLRIDAIVDYWFRRFPWTGVAAQTVAEKLRRRVFELAATKTVPMPGVPEVFDVVRSLQVTIGLCSSSPSNVIDATLAYLGIANVFDVTYSAEGEVYGKPHPGAYLTTAKMLGISPLECLVFEDSFSGALAAKSAKMTVIGVPAKKHLEDARFGFCDVIIPSLKEFSANLFCSLQERRA